MARKGLRQCERIQILKNNRHRQNKFFICLFSVTKQIYNYLVGIVEDRDPVNFLAGKEG